MSIRVAFFKEAVPGIVLGLLKRYTEIKTCLFAECDSHILKVEKVLIHIAFVLGYASPSRLIWEMVKKLLIGACANLGTLIADHPNMESGLRMVLSLVEQIQLANLWDHVRDGSICLRFNNCDGDFLGQLNNIKIKTCNVRFPFDDRKRITVCERLFNDSPLILLAIGMALLALIASKQLGPELIQSVATTIASTAKSDGSSAAGSSQPPALRPGSNDDDPSDPPATDPPPTPADPNAPPPDPPVPPTDPSAPPSDPPVPPTDPSDPPTDPPDVPPTDPKHPPEEPKGPSTPKRRPKPPPEMKTQVLHTQCPKCAKSSYLTVPRPWELCCSKSVGIIATRKNTSKADAISEEVIKELMKDIKCAYCRDKLKKKLQEIASRKYKEKKKDAKKSPKK